MKVSRRSFSLVIAAMAFIWVGHVFGETEEKAEKPEAKRRGGLNILTVETIQKKLGEELKLEDAQREKVAATREEIGKKWEELRNKPAYVEAKAEESAALAKVKAAGKDAAAKKAAREEVAAAEKKVKAIVGEFSAHDEYKKALAGILNEEQMAKLFSEKKAAQKVKKANETNDETEGEKKGG